MKYLTYSLILVTLSLVACNTDKLKNLQIPLDEVLGYGIVTADFCTSPPAPAQQNLKYIFILDHSASNKPGFLVAGDVTSTDPGGARRYGPMVNFISNLVPDPNTTVSYTLIDFQDNAYQPGSLTGFDSDQAHFLGIVNTDWIGGGTAMAPSPNDLGFTNYQSALYLAKQLITADANASSVLPTTPMVTTVYQIIFVSDGVPTIATNGGTYTQDFTIDIQPVIDQILSLKNDPTFGPWIANITLNTAYYSNATQVVAAETLLQQMATEGNGQYLQFSTGQNVLYQQFTPPPRNLRNELVDVYVQNQNAVWWDDGRLLQDTDGDGLPDAIELQYGSNPLVADSDGNGVSDLVEYRTKGKPCNDSKCSVAGRDPYSVCAGFISSVSPGGTVTFTNSTNDGLNDCEKFLLGANRNLFNTNGNMVPDDYAFKSGLPIAPHTQDVVYTDPFGDGVINATKLKIGMPIQFSDKRIEVNPRTFTLTPSPSSQWNINCYHLEVNNMALTALNNSIKLMVVQNSSALQNKPFLQTATKTINQSSLSVSFSQGDLR